MDRHLARIAVLLALTPAIFACDRRRPVVADADMANIIRELPGMTPRCIDMIRYGGLRAAPDETEACYDMLPRQRWTGIWLDAFEGSQFCPDRQPRCSFDKVSDGAWLEFRGGRPFGKHATQRFYRVDLIGRRTVHAGHHGHFGVADHALVVDRLLSIQPLPSEHP